MGRSCEVFLISPDGKRYTTREAAIALGMSVNAVRCGCARPQKEYRGWKIERISFPKHYNRKKAKKKSGEGYDEITTEELYEQWRWCRESPDVVRIMKDFSGMKNVKPLLDMFEERRREREAIRAGIRFMRQLMADLLVIVLHDQFRFSRSQIIKALDALPALHDEFAVVFNGDTRDQEYSREVLDRRLRKIAGDMFIPWEERYE